MQSKNARSSASCDGTWVFHSVFYLQSLFRFVLPCTKKFKLLIGGRNLQPTVVSSSDQVLWKARACALLAVFL